MTTKREQSSKRRSLWRIAKTFCLFACIGYLVKQSLDLVWQYTSKETQISPDYSYQDNVIPGVTICYPRALSLLSILKDINNDTDLHDLRETFGKDQEFFKTLNEDNYEEFNEYYRKKMEQGDNSTLDYLGVMDDNMNAIIRNTSRLFGEPVDLSFADSLYWAIMLNLARGFDPKHPAQLFRSSIPFTNITYDGMRIMNWMLKKPTFFSNWPNTVGPPVDVSVYGVTHKQGVDQGDVQANTQSKLKDDDPIESIIFNDDTDWKKCFTFFSHLKPKWRNMSMVVRRINVDVFHKRMWFPKMYFDYEGFTISMHNPDEFANTFLGIPANRDIRIDYQVRVNNQSEVKEKVNCVDYDLTSEQWWRRTRYDCIKNCMQESQEKCTNCSDTTYDQSRCFFEGNSLWSMDQMPNSSLTILKLDTGNTFLEDMVSQCSVPRFHFETQCRKTCRVKCVDRHYYYQVKNSAAAFASRLEITHRLPDQLSTVLYKMSWVDFVSQVGGLFGLWLGLSFYAISEYLITLFKYLYKKLSCSNKQLDNKPEETELNQV